MSKPTHVLVQTDGRCPTCNGTGRFETRGRETASMDVFMSALGQKSSGVPTCAACIGTGFQIGRVTLANLKKVLA